MHFTPPALDREFVLTVSRSSGKGGQSVNKTATRVQLMFCIPASLLLTETEKAILLDKLAGKLTAEGEVQVSAQTERTQLGNREAATKKMYALLNRCFVVRKKRKPTKPGAAVKEKRLQSKKRKGQRKADRKVRFSED